VLTDREAMPPGKRVARAGRIECRCPMAFHVG